MLVPFIFLISNLLQLYVVILIIWTILSTLISFKIINGYQPFIQRLMYALEKLCEPTLRPIRKFLPDLAGLDISPIILIIIIQFIQQILFRLPAYF